MLFVQISVVLFLIIGLFFYSPWRINRLFGIKRRWLTYVGIVVVVAVAMTSFGMVSQYDSNVIDSVYLLSTVLLGFLFYLFLSLLLIEPVLAAKKMPKRTMGLVALIAALAVSGYGVWNAYQFETVEEEIALDGLKKPMTVVVLADLQLGGHRGRPWLEKTVEAANQAKPELVLIPGDLVDGRTALNFATLAPLQQLNAPAYFVTGNHDLAVGTQPLKTLLRELGINVLENDVQQIRSDLQLVGLEFMNADDEAFDLHPSSNTDTIKTVLPSLLTSADSPVLLMHHSPVGESYAAQAGFDLYVASHTHGGGQVFPATLIACRVFYTYCDGLNLFEGLQIYVSQGLGTFTLPMRVGTWNQLDILRLVPAQ